MAGGPAGLQRLAADEQLWSGKVPELQELGEARRLVGEGSCSGAAIDDKACSEDAAGAVANLADGC